MKASISFKLFLFIFCVLALSPFVNSQEMKKPDPIKSSTLEMLMGNWVAEPYEMMGSKWNEQANHYMKHGQFMYIDITGKSDKGETYTGTIIIKPGMDGSFTGWSFDDWGMVGSYSGTAKDNHLSVAGKSDWGTENREITINGNTMEQKITWVMKGPDGKDMTNSLTINYKKQ